MVKGVNKTIIEVNNTGSRYFEKIVFYVTPQYGNLSAKQLKKAATTFSFNFDAGTSRQSLRKIHNRRKKIFLLCCAFVFVCGLITAGIVIF